RWWFLRLMFAGSPVRVAFTCFFFFSSRRRHTRSKRDWSSDVCSSDLLRDGGLRLFCGSCLFSRGGICNNGLGLAGSRLLLRGGRSEERRVGKEWRGRGAPEE